MLSGVQPVLTDCKMPEPEGEWQHLVLSITKSVSLVCSG